MSRAYLRTNGVNMRTSVHGPTPFVRRPHVARIILIEYLTFHSESTHPPGLLAYGLAAYIWSTTDSTGGGRWRLRRRSRRCPPPVESVLTGDRGGRRPRPMVTLTVWSQYKYETHYRQPLQPCMYVCKILHVPWDHCPGTAWAPCK